MAIEESSVAPEVNEALAAGDKRLASAGFHSRSGFLISPTFGGGSWLAHSTLNAGLWVHNLRRYAQLIPERRFTLASAFNRAGWRTVDEDVSNNRPWPEGKHFYHWDKIYNRNQVGYKGPTFSYAAMPDQYIYSALQRLELGKRTAGRCSPRSTPSPATSPGTASRKKSPGTKSATGRSTTTCRTTTNVSRSCPSGTTRKRSRRATAKRSSTR